MTYPLVMVAHIVQDALRERVALLKGMKENQLETVWLRLHLNPAAVPLIESLKADG